MRDVIFYAVLRPLIWANYWLRAHRLARDKWFWADVLAVKWGYLHKIWKL